LPPEVRVTRQLGRGDELVLIENIPMLKCRHCGEGYFTAQTLLEMERIKSQGRQLLEIRKVSVLTYRD
jgi:YgiT-type zinc finger domain-containing protein